MAKPNIKVWLIPLVTFWLFAVLVFIISKIIPVHLDKAGFDKWRDFYISTSIGIGSMVTLWVILLRYKKLKIWKASDEKRATRLLFILTLLCIIGAICNLINTLAGAVEVSK
jgi:SNF family Na+-dependent transporter